MKTVKVTFKPGTLLFSALCFMSAFSNTVVILNNYTLMCNVPVFDLDRIKALRSDYDVEYVSLFDNDTEAIQGLFGEDD